MKNKFLHLILGLLTCIHQVPLIAKVVVFDAGGVCFDSSKSGMAREVDALGLFFNKITGGDPKARMFEFLNESFGYQPPVNPHDPVGAWLYATGQDLPLPEIWCDYMRGDCTGAELLARADEHYEKFFTSHRELKLIKGLMKAIFDPTIIAKHMHPIKKGAKLVADVARKEGNTCMMLSNFGADAFDALYAQKKAQKKIFQHIAEENIIVSGHIGMMKPCQDIYEYLKMKLFLMDARFADPIYLAQECIFIDDQIENVIAARKRGLTALWLSDGDYKKLRHELEILGVL